MAIVLYYGSGSPFAWRVQLALEHKSLAYERKVLSFAAGGASSGPESQNRRDPGPGGSARALRARV